MASNGGVKTYTTTLIFCIFVFVLTLALIGLLVFQVIPEKASYFVITIVLGLILVASLSLYSIIKYEKQQKEESRNLLKGRLNSIVCPDFYTRSNNDLCLNTYTTGDNMYTYKITGGSNIDLTKYLNKPLEDVCKSFTNDAFKNGINVPSSNVVPWTFMSTKCDVI
jgi:hypothetical protein